MFGMTIVIPILLTKLLLIEEIGWEPGVEHEPAPLGMVNTTQEGGSCKSFTSRQL